MQFKDNAKLLPPIFTHSRMCLHKQLQSSLYIFLIKTWCICKNIVYLQLENSCKRSMAQSVEPSALSKCNLTTT